MNPEQDLRLDESFYRDAQWIAENGRYIHENNGANSCVLLAIYVAI
jgi:hypothetical protein